MDEKNSLEKTLLFVLTMENLSFVDRKHVPSPVLDREWPKIANFMNKMKEALGDNLVRAELFPNVSVVEYGQGHALEGVVFYVKGTTKMESLQPFLTPLYQHMTVCDISHISQEKIDNCKLKDLVESPQAQGSGIAGEGVYPLRDFDMVEAYEKRSFPANEGWYTSLGLGNGGIANIVTDGKQKKIIVAGGHEGLHYKMLKTLAEYPATTIKQMIRASGPSITRDKIYNTVNIVCDLQKKNQAAIIKKICNFLEDKPIDQEPYTNFDVKLQTGYSCFYNTVHEKIENGSSLCAITQGVYHVSKDLDIQPEKRTEQSANIFMIHKPWEIQQLVISKSHMNKMEFFPLTVGRYARPSPKDAPENDGTVDFVKNKISWPGKQSYLCIKKLIL